MNKREIQWRHGEWFSRVSFDGGRTWEDWRDMGSNGPIDQHATERWDAFRILPPLIED